MDSHQLKKNILRIIRLFGNDEVRGIYQEPIVSGRRFRKWRRRLKSEEITEIMKELEEKL